jgi:small-conductance mechanosensitive channel
MSNNPTSNIPAKLNEGVECHNPHGDRFYTELNRIVAWLFVGMLALMTFLLTVGYNRPHKFFAWSLYSSIVILALNLVAYVAGHAFHSVSHAKRQALLAAEESHDELNKLRKDSENARKRIRIVRIVQQVLFVVAVVAVACMALAVANFFFTIAPATQAAP